MTTLKPLLSLCLLPMLSLSCWLSLGTQRSLAQIVPDNTLEDEASSVRDVSDVRELIEGGAVRGSNLFHSFEEFSIDVGREAYFANPNSIDRIFSRITGDGVSEILGTLGVNGAADLYLLNPNGIVFGPESQLDVRGSFVASTANQFTFPDGDVFSTTEPESAPLLTVNVPLGLQTGTQAPAPIVNAGSLSVGQNQSLTLAGGTVVSTGELSAPGGQISVAAVPGNSVVQFTELGELTTWSALADQSDVQADEAAASAASVDDLLDVAGVEDTDLPDDIQPGTTLVSGRVDVSDVEQQGGTVQILGDRIGLLNADVDASGLLGGGNVWVGGNYQGEGPLPNAMQTYVDQVSVINADALQEGDGGQVIVWADGTTEFFGNITAQGGLASGNGGFAEVSGHQSLVFDGTSDLSAENGLFGTLLLDPDNLFIIGDLSISDGNGTQPTITQNRLQELPNDQSLILAATNNIIIGALQNNELLFSTGAVDEDSGEVLTSISFIAGGDFTMNAGDTIRARQRNVSISGTNLNIGSISTAVPLGGSGNAGNITLDARGTVNIRGFSDEETENPLKISPYMLSSFVSRGVNGNAGDIIVEAQGGIIFQATLNQQEIVERIIEEGGDQNTNYDIDNPFAIAAYVAIPIIRDDGSQTGGVGNGGAVTVISQNGEIVNNLTIIDQNGNNSPEVAGIINSSTPNGIGGKIELRANEDINVGDIGSNVGDIGSFAENGNSGRISIISTEGSVNTTRGQINSAVLNGTAGAITVRAGENIDVASINSASFDGGDGGLVTLDSGNNLSVNSITTYAENGTGGTVDIDVNGNISNINSIDTGFSANSNSGIVDIDVDGDIESIGSINTDSGFGNDQLVDIDADGDITIRSIFTGDGSLEITGRTITQLGGTISVNGNADFVSTQPGSGNVTIRSAPGLELGESIIGGNFNIFTSGEVTQLAGSRLQVAGETRVNGDLDPELNERNNFIPILVIENDDIDTTDVVLNQVGLVNITDQLSQLDLPTDDDGEPVVTGDLIVNSLSTGQIEFNDVYDADAITLNGANNSFGGTVTFRTDVNAIEEPITGTPEIVQTAGQGQQVRGSVFLNATSSGNITLDNSENQFGNPDSGFGNIGFIGNNVSIQNQLGTNIVNTIDSVDNSANTSSSEANGNLQIVSGGTISQTDAFTVNGNADFVSTLAGVGTVAFSNTEDVVLDDSAIGGNLSIVSRGSVSQLPDASLRVAGDEITIEAPGGVDLSNSNNTIPDIELSNGDVIITRVGLINLPIRTVTGNLTVTSVANGERFLGAFLEPAITLEDSGNRISGTVSLNTALPGTEPISGNPGITQSGPQVVNNTATFNATTGNITLPSARNQFGDVAFRGNNVSIRENGAMNLLNSEATGAVNLVADESMTQTGSLDIQGSAAFTALDPGGFIRLTNSENAISGPIQLSTQASGNVELQNSLSTQLSESAVGGNLTITSGGDLTQNGRLTVSDFTILDAGANNILFDNAANDFRVVSVTDGQNVAFRDANSIWLGSANVGRNFTVSAADRIIADGAAIIAGGRQRGTLRLDAPSITLQNGSIIANQTTNSRPGGNVIVNASDSLWIEGSVLLANISTSDPDQVAGNILINTEDLVLREGAIVSSSVLSSSLPGMSQGSAGSLTVNADTVDIRGVKILDLSRAVQTLVSFGVAVNEDPLQISPSRLATTTNDAGDAGSLSINARELILQDGGIIATATSAGSTGRGGELIVNVSDRIRVSGTRNISDLLAEIDDQLPEGTTPESNFIPSLITTDAIGDGEAGNLTVTTKQLSILNGAAISSSTSSSNRRATGGQMTINVSDEILLDGTAPNGFASGLYAQSFAAASAGSMDILTFGDLILQNGARISVASGNGAEARIPTGLPPFSARDTEAIGNAGELNIEAQSLIMSDGSRVTAETAAGEGGNIEITVEDFIFLRNDSDIRTEAGGTGNGGNITLRADVGIFAQLPEDSDVIANAFEGDGGNIFATAPLILGFRQYDGVETPESDFVASSEFGRDGQIDLVADEPPQTEDLPVDVTPPEVEQGCLAGRQSTSAQFRNVGRGGLSTNPYEPLSDSGLVDDTRLPQALESSQSDTINGSAEQHTAEPLQITEASRWTVDDAGKIVLIAENQSEHSSDPEDINQNHCQTRLEIQL